MANVDASVASDSGKAGLSLLCRRHAKYLARFLKLMPESTSSFDTSRMTLAFFVLSGLDIMASEEEATAVLDDPATREKCRKWIKSLYVHDKEAGVAGFHGGTFVKVPGQGFLHSDTHVGHAAMTYTALACLYILHDPKSNDSSDPLEGFDKAALAKGIGMLQRSDGSFNFSSEGGEENDMRFIFCAMACCHMLSDWSSVNCDAVVKYILASQAYDGGIAQGPGLEAHGGSTYCAIASLKLMGRLESAFSQKQRRKLIRWCVNRLVDANGDNAGQSGFNGRPNKPVDTCYSFWVGAALTMLQPFSSSSASSAAEQEVFSFVGRSSNFSLATQDPLTGGLAKWVDNSTDPLHTYLGLGGLALAGYEGLRELDPALNVTRRALSGHQGHS